MSDHDVRAGIQQAKVAETDLKILTVEALIIAVIGGGATHAGAVCIFTFLGTVLAFYAMGRIPEQLANLFAAVIGLAWSVVAFSLMTAVQATQPTAWGIAIPVGLM